jgi:hypothetical protein
MDLLIIRLGINYDELSFRKVKKFYKKTIPDYRVIVITGENDSIETKFEVVKLK